MATVRITLSLYNRSWDFPWELLKKTFPQSILTQALQDNTETDLTINNSHVTPAVMDCLLNYLTNNFPSQHIPELILAERYLNLPQLLPFAYPEYDLISNMISNVGWWDTKLAQEMLVMAVKTGNTSQLKYLLGVGVTPGQFSLYTFHIEPFFMYSALYEAINPDHLESFILLLQDGRAFETITLHQILELTVTLNAPRIAHYIYEQTPSYIDWVSLMELAIDCDRLDIVKIFYGQIQVNYADAWILYRASIMNRYEIFQWLLLDSGYQPYLQNYSECIERFSSQKNPWMS